MKKVLTALLMVVSVVAMAGDDDKVQKNTARVETRSGVSVFIYSEPVREYMFLGDVRTKNAGWTMSGTLEETINITIKRMQKQYPQADGIIINSSRADAIKFKE